MKQDSKSPAQAGMLNEIKDVGSLKIWIEEVRLDQDMKLKCGVCVISCKLEYRMPYYQGGCNISGLTLPKVLIAIPCEKNQRETLGSRKPMGDRSSRPV